ncbi:transcriptional regulatory protein C25B8.11 [Colletotrichum truncatum]|uniref:Transcriptional regulatory protein C25B8.11 n=1 Tax=Colletotrichum truncatum TaxID=5467 RepID=A0ACC3YPX9_COLTU|nr:transcriptional regulatory protein C25B8.11 [Colletotrichum truncatum]KAF6796762.1 transcriptional regulatory protein C25B8.11 [Colletotrichum truncatum]
MSKRQRPCDLCRSRKTACRIDQAPPCRLCVLHGRECTFVEAAVPRKRPHLLDGLGVHDGVTTQSLSLQSEQANSPNSMNVLPSLIGETTPGDTTMNFAGDFNFDTTQSEFEAMFRSPRLPSTPSVAGTPETSIRKAAVQSPKIDYLTGANPQLLGLSSDMDPILLRSYRYDEEGMFGFKELAISSVQDRPMPCQFLISQQSLFSRSREEAGLGKLLEAELKRELEKIVPIEVGKRLIILFLKFINPQWPIFSLSQSLDIYSTPSHTLAAVYALSLPFAIHDDKLSVDVAYDKPPYPALSNIIEKAVTYEIHSPSMFLIQILLLLVLRPSLDPLVGDAAYRWDLLSRLTSCAATLGLHLDPSTWPLEVWQKAQRRRLSFFIYTLDKWLACGLGRPPLIHNDNWIVTSLEPEDFDDSSLEWTQINILSATVNRLGQLYVQLIILRAELRTSLPDHDGDSLSSHVQTLRKSLKDCLAALSDIIRTLSPDTDSVFWPPWAQYAFSSVCFTLMTMVVTSPNVEEASSWISELQSTRKSLRLKVASFPFLRLGLLRIDAIFWRGISSVLHLEPHVSDAFQAMELT